MRISKLFVLVAVMVGLVVPAAATARAQFNVTPQQRQYAAGMPAAQIVWCASGIPMSIRGPNLEQADCGGRGVPLRGAREYGPNALAVLDRLSGLFRFNDVAAEFGAQRIKRDMLGLKHVRLQQQYRGLRVVGGKMLVHFTPQGEAYQVNGHYIPDIDISATPSLSAADAVVIAQAHRENAGRPAGMLVIEGPAPVVYALDGAAVLAYELTLAHPNPGLGVWLYYVHAHTGDILADISRVRYVETQLNGHLLLNEGGAEAAVTGTLEDGRYYMGNNRYFVFNADTSGAYPDSGQVANRASTQWGTATHPDRIQFSAANNMEACLAFWRNVMGRDSFDNQGTTVRVEVLDNSSENNAYWYNGTITFTVITEESMTDLAVMDVLGHEFGHGVNESVANFLYRNESGALDESFADIFGNSLEFHWQPDGRAGYPAKPEPWTASWYVGEDGITGDEYMALRDMRTPGNPAVMTRTPSRFWGTYWHDYMADPDFDYGGVHINNGVQNFMFYLLSDGGTGVNDNVIAYEVAGIGVSNAVKIAYQSLQYLGPNSTFSNAVLAWTSAAQDVNPDWLPNVQAAWAAVGLELQPVIGPVVKANGQTGDVVVESPGTVEITVHLNTGGYQGYADWWLVALDRTRGDWYYRDQLNGWLWFDGNTAHCRPAYRGDLFDLPSYTVLPATPLEQGEYTVWFGINLPGTGVLDLNNPNLYYRSVDITVR